MLKSHIFQSCEAESKQSSILINIFAIYKFFSYQRNKRNVCAMEKFNFLLDSFEGMLIHTGEVVFHSANRFYDFAITFAQRWSLFFINFLVLIKKFHTISCDTEDDHLKTTLECFFSLVRFSNFGILSGFCQAAINHLCLPSLKADFHAYKTEKMRKRCDRWLAFVLCDCRLPLFMCSR